MVRLARELLGNSIIEKGLLLKDLDFKSIDGYIDLVTIVIYVFKEENNIDKGLSDIIDKIYSKILRVAESRKLGTESYEEYIQRVLRGSFVGSGCVDYTRCMDRFLYIPVDTDASRVSVRSYTWYFKDDSTKYRTSCTETLKNQLSGISVSRCIRDGRYLSFDNLDIEFVNAYNMLTGVLVWVLNSCSARNGVLYNFDKIEIERQLGIIDTIYFSPLRRVC